MEVWKKAVAYISVHSAVNFKANRNIFESTYKDLLKCVEKLN